MSASVPAEADDLKIINGSRDLQNDCSALADVLSSPMVKIYVGKKDDRKCFQLHKEILIQNSDYFAKCLTTGFEEASTNEICLPEEINLDPVHIVLHWLYYKKQLKGYHTDDLITAYKIADGLMMGELKNDLVDTLRQKWFTINARVLPGSTRMLSGLRRYELLHTKLAELCIRYCAYTSIKTDLKWKKLFSEDRALVKKALDEDETPAEWKKLFSDDDDDDDLDDLIKEVLDDKEISGRLFRAMHQLRYGTGGEFTDLMGCMYHEHTDGRSCRSTSKRRTTT